ncbi:MAG: rhodanese-like domain-containing protein [Bacilli bacterium]|nr:rhodanese-like domain-containing protein [Bacilli bacterium]
MIENLVRYDINEGVKLFRNDPSAILLDVRRVDEYESIHILGSINIPVETIEKAIDILKDKEQIIYVYCRSGVRSLKAADALIKMGYKNVIEIGGIIDFLGETIKKRVT